MAVQAILTRRFSPPASTRAKTTSAQHVAARFIDPTFEKLMDNYNHLLKVIAVQDLILASPNEALPLPLLSSAAQRLHLNRGALAFLRSFPYVFSLDFSSPSEPLVRLTPAATQISRLESAAAASSAGAAIDRLSRLLSISPSRSVPLRAIFKVWRELGLPDDFEDSIIAGNPQIFTLRDNPKETNTHILHLSIPSPRFTPAVEQWRSEEQVDVEHAFKQGFPPGMRLTKTFRSRLKEWQLMPYAGPYDTIPTGGVGDGGRAWRARMEKRAVGVVHEFLSLTVEKMVEVEKVSQFRKWLGMEVNIRDLFLDHPGMFYLSTKGKRHTVFLREGYEKGRLIHPNPIYDARMQFFHLVLLRKRRSNTIIPQ
ncbi:putative plant organelle RNA recognition domain-containing protein [Dioscorea sansibarensis]